MPTVVTPIAHWHQTATTVHIKLEVHNAVDVQVQCTNSAQLLITCNSSLRTENTYRVELTLFDKVDTSSIQHTVKPLYITVALNKQSPVEWPRLVQSSERNNKIKVDWDAQQLADETPDKREPISDAQFAEMEYREKVKQQNIQHFKQLDKQQQRAATQYKTLYLLSYNIVTVTCWMILLLSQLVLVSVHGIDSRVSALFWQQQGNLAIMCQVLSSIEMVNIALNLTQGNIISSLMLHLGRNVILVLVYTFAEVQHCWWTFLLYVAWSVGDITRYTYYALSLLPDLEGFDSSVFAAAIARTKTLRVTVPLFVFPCGVLAELGIMYTAAYTKALNTTNIHLAMVTYVLLAYGTGVPTLYKSMLKAYRNDKRSSAVHPKAQ